MRTYRVVGLILVMAGVMVWFQDAPRRTVLQQAHVALPLQASSPAADSTSQANDPVLHQFPQSARKDGSVQRHWHAAHLRLSHKRKKLTEHGPKRFDEPQAAAEFFLRKRLPAGETVFPLAQLRKALDDILVREEALKNKRHAFTPAISSWTEIGPGNIGGRTRAIVINPIDPTIIYAAGVAGGIWKSTDAGASWNATDDLLLNLAVSSLAMDPTNPNILYAGTGEGFFNGDSVRGLGIFKTIDAGGTWTQLSGTVSGVPSGAFFSVNAIALSPADSSRLYAATQFGVWKSTDAGGTWAVSLRNPNSLAGPEPGSNGSSIGCTDLALRTDTAPGNDVILAAFGSFGIDGLFRSADSGASWTQVGTAGDLLVSNQGRMEIAIAPSDNNTMYVSMADNGSVNPTGSIVNVFRSTDGGITWTPRLNFGNFISPFLLSNLVFGAGCFGNSFFSQGWYDNVILVDPMDPQIVWLGGVDLFRSDDGGQNFGIASYWWFDPADPNFVHADHHALAFHPNFDGVNNQILYSGSDGGLTRTDNARASTSIEDCPPGNPLPGIQWTNLNNGYGVTQFYHGDSAKGEDTFGGGAQDNGTNLVNSAATPNNWRSIIGGDGGYFAIDPTNSQIMYGEIQGFPTIRKSTDGGNTFSSAVNGITDSDGLFINPFAMDQNDPNVLWTGGSRPWRTTNAAASWQVAGPQVFFDGNNAWPISAIAIAPSDSQIVYLGSVFGQVARTTNALASVPTWTTFDGANGLNTGFISSLAVHPTNPDIAYCTYSTFGVSHIFRTTDGGLSWVSIDGLAAVGVPEIPVHWIAIRPCNTDQLFVGTELGVFQSEDAGATWTPANTGLAHTVVETLDFQDDFRLSAFTHGRGAFRALLVCPCNPNLPLIDCNANGQPDECDIMSGASFDCNGNSIPDECDVDPNDPDGNGMVSSDCNGNTIPDECEADCNGDGIADECQLAGNDCNGNAIPDDCEADCNNNSIPDSCDLDPNDPDGNGMVSSDCNGNGFPDECDTAGSGTLIDENFEGGLPAGWITNGSFQVTNLCAVNPACDGVRWAYAGQTATCTYADNEFDELISPTIMLGPAQSELRFCYVLDSELGFDFAEVFVNGNSVFRESGTSGGWQNQVIDLTSFRGQTITLTFRFASDASVSGTLGWQVDKVQVISGSADCNGNGIPDECEADCNGDGIADGCQLVGNDCNGNGVPDECDPDCNNDGIPDACEPDCQPNGLSDVCEILGGSPDCNGDGIPDDCQLAGNDCDGNGIPDECDPDLNNNGVPDACELAPSPPLVTSGYPHAVTKNRYLSFVPDPSNTLPHTYQVTHVASGTNFFISPPRTTPAEIAGLGYTFVVSDADPVAAGLLFDFATEPIIHVGGCLIAPGETYEVRATTDGVNFSAPLTVSTAAIPTNGRFWADAVGLFSTAGDPNTTPPTPASAWTPPNGIMNGFDVAAALRGFQKLNQPDNTWTDVNGLSQDRLTNGNDVLRFVNAFSTGSGKEFYPFPTPATCTAGSGMDIPPATELAP